MNRFLTFYYQKIKPHFLQKPLLSTGEHAPFFILSAGRSGSTLLRKMLVTRAFVNIPPESDDLIPKLIKFFLRYNHKPWEYIVKESLEIVRKEPGVDYWNTKFTPDDVQNLLTFKDEDKTLGSIINYFYHRYAQLNNLDAELWGDKTPFLTFRLSWLTMLYPSSKYIYLIRDSRAVVNSFLKMNTGYTLDSATKRWLHAIKSIERQTKLLGKDKVLYLKYEDLVNAPDTKLREVFDFLGVLPRSVKLKTLDLGDDVLLHHRNVRSELTVEYTDKWKRELSKEQIIRVTDKTKKELIKWGYL